MTSLLPRLISLAALFAAPLAYSALLPATDASQEPSVAPTAQQPQAAQIPVEFKTPDALIDSLYSAVTFGPGEECDFKKMKQIFLPGATFIMPPKPNIKRKIGHLEDFFADWREFLSNPQMKEPLSEFGFSERIANRRTDQFGDIAHSYVVFEVRFDKTAKNPLARGVDSIQMIKIDGRWWVSSINTQFQRPNVPLPRRFLDQK